jgi:mannose-6-phosphate isomerase-like protein (cupin superfamily)
MSPNSHSHSTPIEDIIQKGSGALNAMTQTSESKIRFVDLQDQGDARGFSLTASPEALEYIGRTADVHLASTNPGAIRGNHYHLKTRMAMVILPGPKWSFHWDEGEGTRPQQRIFDGNRAILILVPTGASHAVRNDGMAPLLMLAISSDPYDAADRVARKVV